MTPPKALNGSQAKAFLKEINGDLFSETPQGFACLIITVPEFFLMSLKFLRMQTYHYNYYNLVLSLNLSKS